MQPFSRRLNVVAFILTVIGLVAAGYFPIEATLNTQGSLMHLTLSPTQVPSTSYSQFLPLAMRSQNALYISTQGSDANPGTFTAPWLTLQHAADVAPAGALIYVRGGTYQGFTLERSNLAFIGYPGEEANIIGNGSDVNTIKVRNTSGAIFQHLTLRNNLVQYGTGINVENSSGILISGNVMVDNQGFGIVLKNVTNVIVDRNETYHNGNGIEIRYGSAGVVLSNNLIHDNYRTVDSGRSGIGVTFYRTTGPLTAIGNWVWENHSLGDPDPAGVGFEVYAASNITITGNLIWDNETVLETGTDDRANLCNNITFTRNIAYRIHRQQGMILRCASNSLIAHNVFEGLDNFTFTISHNRGSYGSSVEGLRIVNNIATYGRIYFIENTLPASVVIDHNLAYNPGSSSYYGEYIAYVEGYGNTEYFALFQSWTGYEAHGVNEDPLFVDPAAHDYHLTSPSPAIDQGLNLGEPFLGLAPDLGVFEFEPPHQRFP